jgi:hypothetical protein
MLTLIKDHLYKFGFVRNELCDYVLESPENIDIFLRDVKNSRYEFLKPKFSTNFENFEENLENCIHNL